MPPPRNKVINVNLNDSQVATIKELMNKDYIKLKIPVHALFNGPYTVFLTKLQFENIVKNRNVKDKVFNFTFTKDSFVKHPEFFLNQSGGDGGSADEDDTVSELPSDITTTDQINAILRNMPGFLGVFPNDGLHSVDPKVFLSDARVFGVVNFHNEGQEGSHWVCFYRGKDAKNVEYFDPFGVYPTKEMEGFLNRFGLPIVLVIRQIQPLDSEACGYYVTEFIKLRYEGYSLYDILFDVFENEPHKNELLLDDLVFPQ